MKIKIISKIHTQGDLTPHQDVHLREGLRKALEERTFEIVDEYFADQNLTIPYTVEIHDQ